MSIFFVLEVLVSKLTPKGTFRLEGKVRRRVHQFLSFKYAKCFDFFLWGCDEICYRNCLFHHLWYFDNIFFYLRLFYQVKFKVSLVLLCISEWFFSSQPPFYWCLFLTDTSSEANWWLILKNFCNTIDIPNQYHCHSFKVFSCKIIFIIRLKDLNIVTWKTQDTGQVQNICTAFSMVIINTRQPSKARMIYFLDAKSLILFDFVIKNYYKKL